MYKQHKTRLKVRRFSRYIRMWANYNSLSTHAINAITRLRWERGRQYLTRTVFYREIHKSDFTRNQREAAQLRSTKTKDSGSSNGKSNENSGNVYRFVMCKRGKSEYAKQSTILPCSTVSFLADNIRTCTRVPLTFRIDGLLSMKLCTLLLSNV